MEARPFLARAGSKDVGLAHSGRCELHLNGSPSEAGDKRKIFFFPYKPNHLSTKPPFDPTYPHANIKSEAGTPLAFFLL
jgi:hypothetical protein